MTAARSEVLARVRRATEGAAAGGVPRDYRRAGSLGRGRLVELFCRRVEDYRADVRRADDVAAAVADACNARGARTLAVPGGLPTEWLPDGIEGVDDATLSTRELDGVDGALTGCSIAIAETGTIVLAGGPTEGRRATILVPDLHICVVRESQIVELLPEALPFLDPKRPMTFVSGPSATSDIELSRVEGVHGPRDLVVVVLTEQHRA